MYLKEILFYKNGKPSTLMSFDTFINIFIKPSTLSCDPNKSHTDNLNYFVIQCNLVGVYTLASFLNKTENDQIPKYSGKNNINLTLQGAQLEKLKKPIVSTSD